MASCPLCQENHLHPQPHLRGPTWIPEMRYLDCFTFLCDDRGHLLPQVRRVISKKANHWGYPILSAWDKDFQCCRGNPKKKKCEREFVWSLQDMPRHYKCREPLAACNEDDDILDNPEVNLQICKVFEELRAKAPPVVWIMGYPHSSIAARRKFFAAELAKRLNFVHLDLEDMLTSLAVKYLRFCPCPRRRYGPLCGDFSKTADPFSCSENGDNESKRARKGTDTSNPDHRHKKFSNPGSSARTPMNSHRNSGTMKLTPEKSPMSNTMKSSANSRGQKSGRLSEGKGRSSAKGPRNFADLYPKNLNDCPVYIQRLVSLLRSVTTYKEKGEAFNAIGILEIIKMAFLSYPEASGYVVDEFPASPTEAEGFEFGFWPVAAGVYFMSENYVSAKNKACNPSLNFPSLMLRSDEYVEKVVEQTVDEFGYKCLKIPNAERLNYSDLEYIVAVITDLIARYTEVFPEPDPDNSMNQKDEETKPIHGNESESSSKPSKGARTTMKTQSTVPTVQSRLCHRIDSQGFDCEDTKSLRSQSNLVNDELYNMNNYPNNKTSSSQSSKASSKSLGSIPNQTPINPNSFTPSEGSNRAGDGSKENSLGSGTGLSSTTRLPDFGQSRLSRQSHKKAHSVDEFPGMKQSSNRDSKDSKSLGDIHDGQQKNPSLPSSSRNVVVNTMTSEPIPFQMGLRYVPLKTIECRKEKEDSNANLKIYGENEDMSDSIETYFEPRCGIYDLSPSEEDESNSSCDTDSTVITVKRRTSSTKFMNRNSEMEILHFKTDTAEVTNSESEVQRSYTPPIETDSQLFMNRESDVSMFLHRSESNILKSCPEALESVQPSQTPSLSEQYPEPNEFPYSW